MSDDTELMLNAYRLAAKAYAEAKAEQEYQEHMRRSILAMAMKEYAKDHKSAAAQEREALACSMYREHLDKCRGATLAAEMERARLKTAELRIDLYRTEQASLRAERKGYAA